MGCEELIGALRAAAEKKVWLIWGEAEDRAGRIVADCNGKITTLRGNYRKKGESSSHAETERVVAAAHTKARAITLSAQKMLSDRLFRLMSSCLPLLRKEGYEDIFSGIAREFPKLVWHRVRVNPQDVGLAEKYFPGAEVIADDGIVGGADGEAEAGKIRVINTFEKRLERVWGDVLPGLIKDVTSGVADEETPAKA